MLQIYTSSFIILRSWLGYFYVHLFIQTVLVAAECTKLQGDSNSQVSMSLLILRFFFYVFKGRLGDLSICPFPDVCPFLEAFFFFILCVRVASRPLNY